MTLTSAIIITVIAVIFSAFFSGSEIAFVQSSKVRREIEAASGGLISRVIMFFSKNEGMFISTLLVGNNTVLVVYGITFSIIVNGYLWSVLHSEALVLIANTVISTALILICGEFIPKVTFRINPNFMMRILALPLLIIYILLYPLSWFSTKLSNSLLKLFGVKSDPATTGRISIDEIEEYLQHSIDDPTTRENVENEVKIFRNAVDFKDTQIDACMTPRNEIVAVRKGIPREELMQTFIATGLSKIVVYEEDIDDVIGYIHVSELFNPKADWTEKIKPVIFTPETMLANKMMRRLMAEKRSMAIIIDEFGGTAGLVTLEDLVEEIFGEIEDEHDRDKVICRMISEGVYEVSGRAEIEQLREEYHLQLPQSDEYHTLAGYLLENLEALPEKGEIVDIEPYRFTIERMSATRIELVKIEPLS